jgi:hypothetical protein
MRIRALEFRLSSRTRTQVRDKTYQNLQHTLLPRFRPRCHSKATSSRAGASLTRSAPQHQHVDITAHVLGASLQGFTTKISGDASIHSMVPHVLEHSRKHSRLTVAVMEAFTARFNYVFWGTILQVFTNDRSGDTSVHTYHHCDADSCSNKIDS